MTSEELIATYRELHSLSQHMLDLARQEQWEPLLALDATRAAMLATVAGIDIGAFDLSQTIQTELRDMIAAILAADQQTVTLTEVWLSELRDILASASNERKITDAYR
ncbi:hypothetical protein HNQ59_000121 [Chitinivorax tropicus]|uniref:Flagellar protein FliT n=1 Tax=Chitinivorax tropicus TaxID=714531 RepID=A0A840MI43_9PROT|nr:flagellar protein FliT [Chitinivorax tropicus]MBB5016859.1 hypothetical protein [Chitinivorax tropicus]